MQIHFSLLAAHPDVLQFFCLIFVLFLDVIEFFADDFEIVFFFFYFRFQFSFFCQHFIKLFLLLPYSFFLLSSHDFSLFSINQLFFHLFHFLDHLQVLGLSFLLFFFFFANLFKQLFLFFLFKMYLRKNFFLFLLRLRLNLLLLFL